MGLGLSKDADNPNPSDSDSCTGSGTYVKKKYAITMSTVTYSKDIALLKVVLFIMIYLNHTVYDYLLEFVHVIIRGPNSCLTCKGNCFSWYTSI